MCIKHFGFFYICVLYVENCYNFKPYLRIPITAKCKGLYTFITMQWRMHDKNQSAMRYSRWALKVK